jgi:hypothetical protein
MTEIEWLASTDPAAMLGWARSPSVDAAHKSAQCEAYRALSDRKLRLWVEACRAAAGGEAHDYVQALEDPGTLGVALGYWASRDAEDAVPMALRAALLRDVVGNPHQAVALDGSGDGLVNDWWKQSWLTPDVLVLAEAAYKEHLVDGTLDDARLSVLADALIDAGCPEEEVCLGCEGAGWERSECKVCGAVADGEGFVNHGGGCYAFDADGGGSEPADNCRHCGGSGRLPSSLLVHLRTPGPHVRGCWALGAVLCREAAGTGAAG